MIKELIENTEIEERTLQFSTFTQEDILPLGLILIDKAKKDDVSVAIDITVNHTQVFYYQMPGTSKINHEWIERKKRVVNSHNHSSYLMQLYSMRDDVNYNQEHRLDLSYAAYGGSFPIMITGGLIIGMVTVSGLTPEADHNLAVESIRLYLKKQEEM